MLAKSSTLKHPSGILIETPLLVPSFSSKGFRFSKKGLSEVNVALEATAEIITECYLISAYDIFHNHIPSPKKLPCVPEIIFVDSGGFETSEEYDFTSAYRYPYSTKDWDETSLQTVYNQWPKRIPAVFVGFDQIKPIKQQIKTAKKLLDNYPAHLHTLVIKPEKKTQNFMNVDSVISNIKKFVQFNIIGLVEKELGNSALKRMQNIAKIRLALDEAGISVPIQIFGSLDPISSCLYFIAGAEIFDGLTWLRYSYLDGMAIYNYNYGALKIGVNVGDKNVLRTALVDNIYFLQELKYTMRTFSLDEDFSKFGQFAGLMQKSYDKLRSHFKGRI